MDKEKVIGHLNDCMEASRRDNTWVFVRKDIVEDALAMLKEQEAVEPSFKQDEKGIFVWCCGSCGAYMYHIYDGIDKAKEYAKFCRKCGRQVKWDD